MKQINKYILKFYHCSRHIFLKLNPRFQWHLLLKLQNKEIIKKQWKKTNSRQYIEYKYQWTSYSRHFFMNSFPDFSDVKKTVIHSTSASLGYIETVNVGIHLNHPYSWMKNSVLHKYTIFWFFNHFYNHTMKKKTEVKNTDSSICLIYAWVFD